MAIAKIPEYITIHLFYDQEEDTEILDARCKEVALQTIQNIKDADRNEFSDLGEIIIKSNIGIHLSFRTLLSEAVIYTPLSIGLLVHLWSVFKYFKRLFISFF